MYNLSTMFNRPNAQNLVFEFSTIQIPNMYPAKQIWISFNSCAQMLKIWVWDCRLNIHFQPLRIVDFLNFDHSNLKPLN